MAAAVREDRGERSRRFLPSRCRTGPLPYLFFGVSAEVNGLVARIFPPTGRCRAHFGGFRRLWVCAGAACCYTGVVPGGSASEIRCYPGSSRAAAKRNNSCPGRADDRSGSAHAWHCRRSWCRSSAA